MNMDTRIKEHPVLNVEEKEQIQFYWNKQLLKANKGEVISSALFANGIKVFGHHHKDNTAQGIFCANGQCAKCTVIANGLAVKSCMTHVTENMIVESADGLPELPEVTNTHKFEAIEEFETDVLIIGGGPAGLSAAIKMADYNVKAMIVDDKDEFGGKLVLQTHKFFGSVEDSYAGTRGNDIGKLLSDAVLTNDDITCWLNSTAVYVFSDKKVGIVKDGEYKLVKPKVILNAAGAREKFLKFSGNHLPGIYGAGAFQTLVNRDLVRPTERLFIIGGGNVGLIAGYHALQAGIEVVGLVEAMPKCGGYKVHDDKLRRLGVPVYTSHSIISANGEETVESITIAQIDKNFQRIDGTEKTFSCDTILVAVGLESLSEFTQEAEIAGIPVFGAGDALEIAEASSAMFNGKITGLKVAKFLKATTDDVPERWYAKADILKSHPGKLIEHEAPEAEEGVMPNIFCLQEIPCNPCSTSCPTGAINMLGNPIMDHPKFTGNCIGCGKCVAICPGLAITLVDFRKDKDFPIVSVPYEINNMSVNIGDKVKAVDIDGNYLDELEVMQIIENKPNKVQLIRLKTPKSIAKKVVSFRVQDESITAPLSKSIIPQHLPDDHFVCLCERVKVNDVRKLIKQGIYDFNQIKAITRLGMGPCGGKTCDNLAKQIMREEGVAPEVVVPNKKRPVFVEVPLGVFAGKKGE
jgi:NADPH-dependent 2,4-dienoyl-CoA reductase/sulfur reductase-like enzyme/Fe-S-cluster-containing hydrogenase component 2/bacterioferritin-associated ferredoxin